MKKLLFTLVFLCLASQGFAQYKIFNSDGEVWLIDTSADTVKLKINSEGVLLLDGTSVQPIAFTLDTLTTTQRDALTARNGMLIYNSTDGQIQGYDGSWFDAGAAAGSGAPTDATYLTKTPNATLSAENAINAFSVAAVATGDTLIYLDPNDSGNFKKGVATFGGGSGDSSFTSIDVDSINNLTNASTTNIILGDTLAGNITGNAGTATALAANGSNASSGNAILGVDASGNAEGSFDVWTEAENTSAGYIANIVEDTTPQLGADLDGQGNDLDNMGVLFLTEQADAEADVTGKGQLWVDNLTPNIPMFTNDAGTDFQLATLAGTETFTNKTIDADGTGNSITNIENADIKAAAGIVYSKLTFSNNIVAGDIDEVNLWSNATLVTAASTDTALIRDVTDGAYKKALVSDFGGGSALATQIDGVEQASDTEIYDWDANDFTLTESPANDFDIALNSQIPHLDQVETISANWVNTANPWADNEVADALTLAGGTIGTSAITLVQGVAPTPTAEGVIEWETDDDHIIIGDAVDQVEFVPTEDVSGDATMTTAGALTISANAVTSGKINDGEIVNADINASAGIVYSKLTFSNNIVAGDIAADAVGESELIESMNFTGTGSWDFGGGVLEIPNGTSGTTNATGETFLDTDGDGGTNFSGEVFQVFNGSANKYLFLMPLPDAGTEDNYVPKYDATGKTVQWEADAQGAGVDPGFDNASDPIVQQSTGKDVQIGDGAGTLTGKLEIGGDADQPQVVIEGHSTQTDDVLIIQNDADTEVFSISVAGVVTSSTGAYDGEHIQDATIDDDAIDFSTGTGVSGADMPDEDLGDVSVATGAWTLDADVVDAAAIATDAVQLAELDDDANTPLAGDFVTVETGAATVTYTTPNAGTDITADLEEEVIEGSLADDVITEAELKAVNAAVDEDILTYEATTGDFEWHTPAELGLLTAETNALESDGASGIADTEVFIGTGAGTGNYAVISGDGSLANTGALTVNDDSHNHVITNIDAFTVAQLQTQTSDVTTFYTEDTVVPLADGGTGVAFSDPNVDALNGWDDSAGRSAFFLLGDGLESSADTTLSVTWEDAADLDATGSVSANAVTSAKINDDEIVNADINSAAAIVYSKLSFSDNIVAGDIGADAVGESELIESMNFTATGSWDFGGATSVELPNADDPTTNASGEIAFDNNANAIEVYDGANSALIPTLLLISKTILFPDQVQAGIDNVPLLAVEVEAYPHGITIVDCGIKTDASSSYSLNFEEWTSPTDGAPSTIETVATSTSTEAEDDGTLSDASIASGSIVMADLDTDDINWVQVWFTFRINDGN